jgi:hypothetical protein
MWLTIQKFFRFLGRFALGILLIIALLIIGIVVLAVQVIANAPM